MGPKQGGYTKSLQTLLHKELCSKFARTLSKLTYKNFNEATCRWPISANMAAFQDGRHLGQVKMCEYEKKHKHTHAIHRFILKFSVQVHFQC